VHGFLSLVAFRSNDPLLLCTTRPIFARRYDYHRSPTKTTLPRDTRFFPYHLRDWFFAHIRSAGSGSCWHILGFALPPGSHFYPVDLLFHYPQCASEAPHQATTTNERTGHGGTRHQRTQLPQWARHALYQFLRPADLPAGNKLALGEATQ